MPLPCSTSVDASTTVQQLRDLVQQFVAERRWEKFHNAKNLSMALTVEAGELMEHFQWLTTAEIEAGTGYDPQQVADELADIACYALSIANSLEIDLTQAITQKMVKNRAKYPAEPS